MLQTNQIVKVVIIELLVLITLWPDSNESLIITSVLAGDKKFKTISFDSKFLKPLTFEKDLPTTQFRRHRTLRPPKFDIDVNIPIKLPLEDEYPQEEYKKPVESEFFFQTDEIKEPGYKKAGGGGGHAKKSISYDDEYTSSSDKSQVKIGSSQPTSLLEQGFKLLPVLAKSIKFKPQIEYNGHASDRQSNARSDTQEQQQHQSQPQVISQSKDLAPAASYQGGNYYQQQKSYHEKGPDFIPGGFVNLQLSGPTGGPKMTYEDYDKELWAQQLSQTPDAMPYPILNYHQLQNFYGGLGTFTNGLADQRYTETSLKEKLLSGLMSHFSGKFHIG